MIRLLLLLALLLTLPRAAGADEAGDPGEPPAQDWERATVLVGVRLSTPTCEAYQARDGWDGRECTGLVLTGVNAVLRPTDGFMLYLGAEGGIGWTSDLRVIHELSVSDEAESLLSGQFASSLGAGLAVPAPAGELRVGGGLRLDLDRVDPNFLRRIEDEFELVMTRIGGVALSGEVVFGMDAEPTPRVRLGPRLTFRVGDEVTLLYREGAEEEERAMADDLAEGPAFTILPGFAISLFGPEAALYLEVVPAFRVKVRSEAAQQRLMARGFWLTEPEQVRFDTAVLFVLGGELRLGRPG